MLALGSCDPPDSALVHGCTRSPLDLFSHCYVRAKRLDTDQLAAIDTDTKNEKVAVKVTVRVRKGEATIELPGCAQGRGIAKPGQPFVIQCDSKIERTTYKLWLWARPKSGPVEGLDGEVTFRAI